MMVNIDFNLYASMVAATVVFVLAVLISFVVWVFTHDDRVEDTSGTMRWKWMCVAWLIVFAFMQLTKT